MSQNHANYPQNYQNYYQSATDQYDNFYEDDNQDLKENYEDEPEDLQVPNSRLYAEGYPEVTELYSGNTQFCESQQQMETTSMPYRQDFNPAPNDQYYNVPSPQQHHHHHRTRVPPTKTHLLGTCSHRPSLPHSVYPLCPLATSQSLQGASLPYIPKVGTNPYSCMGRAIPQNVELNNLNPDETAYIPNVGATYSGTGRPVVAQDIELNNLNPEETDYIAKVGATPYSGIARTIPQQAGVNPVHVVGESYNMQGYNDHQDMYQRYDRNQRKVYTSQENYGGQHQMKTHPNREIYGDQNQRKAYPSQESYGDQSQMKVYPSQENYGDCCVGATPQYTIDYGPNQEIYVNYKGKTYRYYGNKRLERSKPIKKHPVTVKTPKYFTKSPAAHPLHKKPSALCLPVVSQEDPGLVKRKSKTHHHMKRSYDQSEPVPQNPNDTKENYSFSAHEMHSEGDMNQKSTMQGLDNLLDQFENKVGFKKKQGDIEEGEAKDKIKGFSKFLKPKVPSSIKAKQERIAKMKSSLNMSGIPLQPRMKLSLDKLLNRLQKCEVSESGEKLSDKSSQKGEDEEKNNGKRNIKHGSFNYENLARKLSPTVGDPDSQDDSKILLHKPSTSLTTSLDNKKSSRLLRPLDDHCAIDLHRSKSYIVDLIDRALSKELGTVPRGSSIMTDMTPKRAIKTISRHRQSCHDGLCYEVTAALTDSFISNITAPQKEDQLLKRSGSDEGAATKLCTSFGDDNNYIKQLKQLRWGHIRHIQHEARKLADLEEFLEKCGGKQKEVGEKRFLKNLSAFIFEPIYKTSYLLHNNNEPLP